MVEQESHEVAAVVVLYLPAWHASHDDDHLLAAAEGTKRYLPSGHAAHVPADRVLEQPDSSFPDVEHCEQALQVLQARLGPQLTEHGPCLCHAELQYQ